MFLDKLGLQEHDLLQLSDPPYKSIPTTEMPVKWFIETPEFQEWEAKEHTALLWHHSGSGQGKTVIMSCLKENISDYFGYTKRPDVGAIFISPSSKVSEDCLVASLVFQLMKNNNRADYALRETRVWSASHNELKDHMWELLETMIIEVPTRVTVFLIDGIDNLETETRSKFLRSLSCLVERQIQSKATLRVLISSNPRPDLRNSLSHYIRIEQGQERKRINPYSHTII